MKEVPDDPWFIDKAARRAAGESDVEFFIETDDAPWIWTDHPHVLKSERAKAPDAWVKQDIARLWLPYPSWADQTYAPLPWTKPDRAPDIIISNVGKMPQLGFWSLHPKVERENTVFDDDGGGFWRAGIWLKRG
jgi:hypothetical protein